MFKFELSCNAPGNLLCSYDEAGCCKPGPDSEVWVSGDRVPGPNLCPQSLSLSQWPTLTLAQVSAKKLHNTKIRI